MKEKGDLTINTTLPQYYERIYVHKFDHWKNVQCLRTILPNKTGSTINKKSE